MKKSVIFLIVVIIICGIAVLTCPKKEAHTEVLMGVVNNVMNEKLNSTNTGELNEATMVLASSLGSSVLSYVLESRLDVENHFLWSTGKIRKLDGKSYIASIGLFGHVFTFWDEKFFLDNLQNVND